MSRFESFLGFPNASDKALHLGKILFFLFPFANVTFTLSTTFYTIFVAEALGNGNFMDGLGLLGMLVVIQMAVQTMLDYPSGAIGDWIGQRWVIASGNFCYALSFLMVSFVTINTPFVYLAAIYALQGLASSQISGAWGAWFDSNYKIANPADEDRKEYGVFWGRMGMISQIAATVSLIPGSLLAAVFNRPWVFQLQFVAAAVFALLVLRLIKDFPEVEAMREGRPSLDGYMDLLKGGVSYIRHTPYVKYIIVGGCVTYSTITVWGELILFPMYFSYLITDVAVASFRTIAFLPGVAAQERSGIWSRRFEPKKWIPRFRLLQAGGFIFYIAMGSIMYFFPPLSNGNDLVSIMLPFTSVEILRIPLANVLPTLLIFLVFCFTVFFGGFAEILTQRVLLDVIPNKNRNSIYSLSPTILFLFAMPQIGLYGWLIPLIGFPLTLALCGLVSVVGVLIIRYGLDQPRPVITETEGETLVEGTSLGILDMETTTLDVDE
ncbi:MAG: MFS transporter [Candidatus Thorarchaeota archaeon]|nr:MFS transporter [Candidatus Thorarchaeota archaeon]